MIQFIILFNFLQFSIFLKLQKMFKLLVLAAVLACTVLGAPAPQGCRCDDFHSKCKEWAFYGQCIHRADWMNVTCPNSCGTCKSHYICKRAECRDNDSHCGTWKAKGYCTKNYVAFMNRECAKTCGTCDIAPSKRLI